MTREEYEALQRIMRIDSKIRVTELLDLTPRMLIYGYDCDRNTFSLSLIETPNGGLEFERKLVKYPDTVLEYTTTKEINIHSCVPNKRIYPDRCDFEFCTLLHNREVYLPFTTFRDEK